MGKLGFGELELTILRIVRELGRAAVRDVYEKLGCKGSYTTIMTVMSRMAEKGDLKREKNGKQYIYWTASRNAAHSKSKLKQLLKGVFGGKPTKIVSYLLGSEGEVSDSDLEEIEALVKKVRAERKGG